MNIRLQHFWAWFLCLLAPWISSAVLYFVAKEQWVGLIGCCITASATGYLGLKGFLKQLAPVKTISDQEES